MGGKKVIIIIINRIKIIKNIIILKINIKPKVSGVLVVTMSSNSSSEWGDGWMSECVSEWMSEWMSERVSEWTS